MFGALKRGRFRSLASLILVVNVVGELQQKRTLAASRGFLAAVRLSCTSIQSPFSRTRTKPEPDPKPGFCGLPNPKPVFSKKAPGLESLVARLADRTAENCKGHVT